MKNNTSKKMEMLDKLMAALDSARQVCPNS